MSEHERQRARERAELEVEFRRLDDAYEVLLDMAEAAWDVAEAREYRGDEFELDRARRARDGRIQVHAERETVRDRLLDYKFTPEQAGQIRAQIAEDQRRARGVERSR